MAGTLFFARNINSNYFGFGENSLAPLRFPGSPATYDSYADYTAAQRRISGGMTWTKYDQFDLIRPVFIASIERMFFRDRIRVLGGLGVTYAGIGDYTGKQVQAVDDAGADTTATMTTTRLRADCDAGQLVGCSGGRENLLRLGLSYDTRDFERCRRASRGRSVSTVAKGHGAVAFPARSEMQDPDRDG